MIDTQRIGTLLATLIRDDVLAARLRTPAAAAITPVVGIGPALDDPATDPALALRVLRAVPLPRLDPAGESQEADRASPDDARTAPAAADGRAASTPGTPSTVRLQGVATPSPTAAPGSPSTALQLSELGLILRDALVSDVTAPAASLPRDGAQPSAERAVAARPAPLASVPPHSEYATDRLALQVKDAVEFSGVFYESHLAQWADGLRPRALLALEPQSRWMPSPDLPLASSTAGAPDFAAPLVRQQLEVLDAGRFAWRGELWPGQPGAITIEADDDPPPRKSHDAAVAAPRWRLRIDLDFAALGAVHACLGLCGEALDVVMRCDDPAAAARLRGAAPALRAAIVARELSLDSLAIAHGRA